MPVSIGPFRSYSVFDSLMRDSINRRYSGKAPSRAEQIASGTAGYTGGMSGIGIGGTRPTGPATSPFVDTETTFVKTEEGVQGLTPEQLEPGLPTDSTLLSPGEAAVESATPTGLREYGRTGRVAQAAIAALSPDPFGIFAGLMGGSQTVDPYGKKAAIPGGILGLVASKNIEQQYDIYDKIQSKTPGYHQFYAQGQLVSIVPQEVLGKDVGFAVLGTNPFGSQQEAVNAYSVMFGYDPITVDLNKSPDSLAFGRELDNFVPGTGGIGVDGKFVDSVGNRMSQPRDVGAYVGMVETVYGRDAAIRAANKFDPTGRTAAGVVGGTVQAKTYMTPDGTIAGYGTGTGGIVTDRNGNPVMGGGKPVGWGTGYITPEQLQQMQEEGRGEGRPTEEETSVDQSPSVGMGMSNVGYAAQGGMITRHPMQVGGEVPPGEAPVATQAAVVGQEPETLPEGTTVADDVPMEVPEGTFVLNAAAVEFMGSADVKKMILEAVAEAEKQGIDIEQQNSTIPKEELVSLVVSRGEVIIPPQLAQIIGYDRLNKINNRGKAEVEKRIEENGQAEQPQPAPETQNPPIAAAQGGMIDLEDVVHYRDFKNPQSSFLNMLEVTGAGITGNLEAMEKAYSYSNKWSRATNAGDNYEDTMRHALVGGLYGDVAGFYADAKEQYHKYVEAYPRIGYEKLKGMLGFETDPRRIENLRGVIAESDIDLNNNAYGRELRKRVPDEQNYVRTLERMMVIAKEEGFDRLPALVTEDGEELRLQLSTAPVK